MVPVLPEKTEIKMLKEYSGDPAKLGKPEAYILAMSKVPKLSLRLQSMLFKLQINELVNSVKSSTEQILSACMNMRSSDKSVRLLGIVLQIGNSMNKGTSKGNAKGIQLGSLMKLTQTRTNSGQTLLEYIIVPKNVRAGRAHGRGPSRASQELISRPGRAHNWACAIRANVLMTFVLTKSRYLYGGSR